MDNQWKAKYIDINMGMLLLTTVIMDKMCSILKIEVWRKIVP